MWHGRNASLRRGRSWIVSELIRRCIAGTGVQGSRDLTGWQGRLGDSEDGGSDAVLPLQIGVVVTTPADSFEREPLPVTNSPDLRVRVGKCELTLSDVAWGVLEPTSLAAKLRQGARGVCQAPD